jgi:hypothetical protein
MRTKERVEVGAVSATCCAFSSEAACCVAAACVARYLLIWCGNAKQPDRKRIEARSEREMGRRGNDGTPESSRRFPAMVSRAGRDLSRASARRVEFARGNKKGEKS